MKVKNIASNMTEVETNDKVILVSYQTPVACHITGKGYFKTDCRWSMTTSKHINKWLAMHGAKDLVELKPQEFFDALI